MKVESGRSIGSATGPKRVAGVGGTGFALAPEETTRGVAVTGLNPVSALDAVLSLQIDDATGRRRARQAQRGRDALDVLEQLERGLLSGRAPAGLCGELERLRGEAEMTGEPGLDGVLREIDTRIAVELAKLEMLPAA